MKTVNDIVKELGVTRVTVVRWIKEGKINTSQPHGKKGKYFISEDEFDRITGNKSQTY